MPPRSSPPSTCAAIHSSHRAPARTLNLAPPTAVAFGTRHAHPSSPSRHPAHRRRTGASKCKLPQTAPPIRPDPAQPILDDRPAPAAKNRENPQTLSRAQAPQPGEVARLQPRPSVPDPAVRCTAAAGTTRKCRQAHMAPFEMRPPSLTFCTRGNCWHFGTRDHRTRQSHGVQPASGLRMRIVRAFAPIMRPRFRPGRATADRLSFRAGVWGSTARPPVWHSDDLPGSGWTLLACVSRWL